VAGFFSAARLAGGALVPEAGVAAAGVWVDGAVGV